MPHFTVEFLKYCFKHYLPHSPTFFKWSSSTSRLQFPTQVNFLLHSDVALVGTEFLCKMGSDQELRRWNLLTLVTGFWRELYCCECTFLEVYIVISVVPHVLLTTHAALTANSIRFNSVHFFIKVLTQ
jgi:hypothetical protein